MNWLTTSEVMKRLHISRTTLNRQIAEGRLTPQRRVGVRENLFSEEEVAALESPSPRPRDDDK